MDIMELGAIGERVGGVGVIGSLSYVGLRIKQATSTLFKASRVGYISARSRFSLHIKRV